MKKRLSLLLAAPAAATLFTACGKKPEAPAAAAAAAQTIVIGLDDNFPPMGFRDDNELVGFDIDLAREAGKRPAPRSASSRSTGMPGSRAQWQARRRALERPDDHRGARKANILFTTPLPGEPPDHRRDRKVAHQDQGPELAGKVVGVQDGSSAVEAVRRMPPPPRRSRNLKKFGDNVTALMDLSAGRLDALVVDEGRRPLLHAKKPGEYRVLEENFGTEDYGVGTRKDDTELMAKLQKAMDEMKADGYARPSRPSGSAGHRQVSRRGFAAIADPSGPQAAARAQGLPRPDFHFEVPVTVPGPLCRDILPLLQGPGSPCRSSC